MIWVYTSQGEVIFQLGAEAADKDISGLFTSLTTIAVDNSGTSGQLMVKKDTYSHLHQQNMQRLFSRL